MNRQRILAAAGAAIVLAGGGAWLGTGHAAPTAYRIATAPTGHFSIFANAPRED